MSDYSMSIVRAWYQKSMWLWLLYPFTLLFRLLTSMRRTAYRLGVLSSWRAPVPILVVGNISVGGTGKTPLVIALVKALQQAGFKPGVVSRGYGSKAPYYPFAVTVNSSVLHSGDEPMLIVKRTGIPLFIAPDRAAAVEQLLATNDCDVVITDDGMQHYALQRDIECVVVDGQRGFGNGQCLPMGPLRESLSRLNSVDFVIANSIQLAAPLSTVDSYVMTLLVDDLVNVSSGDSMPLSSWTGNRQVHAVAGIGNPERFFSSLRQLGLQCVEHVYDDHHHYCADDFSFGDELPVIMTEKDAVKVGDFAQKDWWYLPVDAQLEQGFYRAIVERLNTIKATSQEML